MKNPPDSSTTTFEQRFTLYFFLTDAIAQTTMVFLRRGIGLRALHERTLVLLASVLFIMCNPLDDRSYEATPTSEDTLLATRSSVLPLHRPFRPGYLGLFVCAAVFMAGVHKQRRRRELKQAIVSHTYSRGASVFTFLPANPATLSRIVDPAFAILCGILSWHFLSTALGVWLVISGLALAMVESVIQLRAAHIVHDTLDGLVESELHSENLAPFIHGHPKAQRDTHRQPIPTGLAPDVERHIEARQAMRRRTPPKP